MLNYYIVLKENWTLSWLHSIKIELASQGAFNKPQISLPIRTSDQFSGSLTGASPEWNQRIWEHSHLENSVSQTTACFPQCPAALAVEGLTVRLRMDLLPDSQICYMLWSIWGLFMFLIFYVFLYFFCCCWGLFKSQSWSCLASHSWNKAKGKSLNFQSGKCSPCILHTPCTRISCLCSGCPFCLVLSEPALQEKNQDSSSLNCALLRLRMGNGEEGGKSHRVASSSLNKHWKWGRAGTVSQVVWVYLVLVLLIPKAEADSLCLTQDFHL